MRTISIPRSSSRGADQLQDMWKRIEDKRSEMGLEMMKRNKLTSKTTVNIFDVQRDPSTTRKSLSKAEALIRRRLQKIRPYVDFASTPFLSLADRSIFVVNLKSFPTEVPKTLTQWVGMSSTERQMYVRAQTYKSKLLTRYIKYIQYLCLRHAIPLKAQISTTWEYSQECAVRMSDPDAVAGAWNANAEIIPIFKIVFTLCYVICREFEYNSTLTTFEEFKEHWTQRGQPSLYNTQYWDFSPIVNGPLQSKDQKTMVKYLTPQKIFLYLSQVMSVLKTLSSQATYVPEAFSIGSAQTPGPR